MHYIGGAGAEGDVKSVGNGMADADCAGRVGEQIPAVDLAKQID
jgi:hypothetical protein